MSIQDIAHDLPGKSIERAMQALEELEQAMDAGDNVKIGAALYKLRRELKTLKNSIQDRSKRP